MTFELSRPPSSYNSNDNSADALKRLQEDKIHEDKTSQQRQISMKRMLDSLKQHVQTVYQEDWMFSKPDQNGSKSGARALTRTYPHW